MTPQQDERLGTQSNGCKGSRPFSYTMV